MPDISESIKANDEVVLNSNFRTLIAQYDDPDVITRLAENRIRAYTPASEVERVKLLTAWLDGFTAAARTYASDR